MNNDLFAAGYVPRAAVSAAIFRDGKVLLIQRRQPPAVGLWSLPGGHIGLGETTIAAVHRELREETAIDARVLGVADAVDVIRRDESGRVIFHRVILVFYGLWLAGEPMAGSDAAAVGWYDPNGLSYLPVTEGLVDSVTRAWTRLER